MVQFHAWHLKAPEHTSPVDAHKSFAAPSQAESQALSASTGRQSVIGDTVTFRLVKARRYLSLSAEIQGWNRFSGTLRLFNRGKCAKGQSNSVVTTDSVANSVVTSKPLPHQSNKCFMRCTIQCGY